MIEQQLQMIERKIFIPKIEFDMPITDLVLELEKLRYKILEGTTHPLVFLQMKSIFHMLESIGSSRIEGNNTTIMDYVESTKISSNIDSTGSEQIKEILNIENATSYIEKVIDDTPISIHFIKELHALTVDSLSENKEGCHQKGDFRKNNVRISGSKHTPPDWIEVEHLMRELVEFINKDTLPKYDLLKICVAHHRFVWIHPFENGNGRVVRLFTYALLLKNVFKSKQRIINPTAVFCSDRTDYYNNLSLADNYTDEGVISWCEYVLHGLKNEIEKIDKLMNYSYLKEKILMPSLSDSLSNKYITDIEYNILKIVISEKDQEMQACDIKKLYDKKSSSEISRMIKSLIEKRMLIPISERSRKYVISFENNYLLRSILKSLDNNGFLPLNNLY